MATWKEPSHTARELPHLKIVKTLQLQIKPRPPGRPVCEHPEQFLNARHHGIVSFCGSGASSTVALPLITFSRTKRISTSKLTHVHFQQLSLPGLHEQTSLSI